MRTSVLRLSSPISFDSQFPLDAEKQAPVRELVGSESLMIVVDVSFLPLRLDLPDLRLDHVDDDANSDVAPLLERLSDQRSVHRPAGKRIGRASHIWVVAFPAELASPRHVAHSRTSTQSPELGGVLDTVPLFGKGEPAICVNAPVDGLNQEPEIGCAKLDKFTVTLRDEGK